jgi:hypothetical protein
MPDSERPTLAVAGAVWASVTPGGVFLLFGLLIPYAGPVESAAIAVFGSLI